MDEHSSAEWSAEHRRAARRLLPYLEKCGWLQSRLSGASVTRDGKPIPWITYPALALLEQRVTPEMDVFEFGSGNSTLWWASRVRSVRAVEHDEKWARRVKAHLPANASVTHVPLEPGGVYATMASRAERAFHIVVVDGRDRVNCAMSSVGALRPDGVLLWDNSERSRYAGGLRELAKCGFRQLDLQGLAPIGIQATQTSILYRDGNCFGI